MLDALDTENKTTTPIATGIDLATLNFAYIIHGDYPSWRPIRTYDDGRQVMIKFPDGVAQQEMPPLFVITEEGTAGLVNFLVRGRRSALTSNLRAIGFDQLVKKFFTLPELFQCDELINLMSLLHRSRADYDS